MQDLPDIALCLTEQASSVVTDTNQQCYTGEGGCFSVYGYEYQPGFDEDAYITWVSDNKVSWTAMSGGFAADPRVNISARPIPQEPMVRRQRCGKLQRQH